MISLFMQGGPSHIDLFDPKPELSRRDGISYTGDIKYDNAGQASPRLFGSPWKFARQGDCGMELSELLPGLAGVADDICLVRSMQTAVNNHGQSINAMNTGRITAGRPVVGSWLTYALGSESDELPAYCVLTDPGGVPVLGIDNWSNGWLPSLYQGTVIRPREPRIANLDPPPRLEGKVQERYLGYLDRINRRHLAEHPGEHDLAARIASYELAARMQSAAKEALDFSSETDATRKLYGLDNPACAEFGTRCLIARRLVERGVRFVQVCTGNQEWDHHGGIVKSTPQGVPQGRPALRGPRPRPQAARAPRHDGRRLGGRDGPAPGRPEREERRPRPQHLRLLMLVRRRRLPRRPRPWRDGRARPSRRSRRS